MNVVCAWTCWDMIFGQTTCFSPVTVCQCHSRVAACLRSSFRSCWVTFRCSRLFRMWPRFTLFPDVYSGPGIYCFLLLITKLHVPFSSWIKFLARHLTILRELFQNKYWIKAGNCFIFYFFIYIITIYIYFSYKSHKNSCMYLVGYTLCKISLL